MLGRRGAVATAREYTINQLRQLLDLVFHAQTDESDGCARIEDYYQQQTPSDVGDVDRLLLTLVKQAGEVVFADKLRQLIVGAVIGCSQRSERGGVETRGVTHRRDELPRAIDEQRTK